jgi:two-component system, OmpR family, alkaline phosphatase synthesis response regulator PhoP
MTGETVLIIEDDPTLLRALADNFRFKGAEVRTASDGDQGLEAALELRPDLIVLDIMLPEVNGYEICRALRGEGLEVPIIMLTAKGQESDIVLGLELGADDYVTKPFSIRELLARAKALLRRRHQEEGDVFRFGDCELNLRSRTLTRNGTEAALTPKEFGLLALLVKQAGRAFTRNEILKHVWGYNVFVTSRSVDRCVTTLRHKIGPAVIRTVRGIGYRFDLPDDV